MEQQQTKTCVLSPLLILLLSRHQVDVACDTPVEYWEMPPGMRSSGEGWRLPHGWAAGRTAGRMMVSRFLYRCVVGLPGVFQRWRGRCRPVGAWDLQIASDIS